MEQGFALDFGGMAGVAPRELTVGALLPADGYYKVRVVKVQAGRSKSMNSQLAITVQVLDDDGDNALVVTYVPTSGKDKNGDPNVRKLVQVLYSTGLTQAQVASIAAGQVPADKVVAGLVNREGHVEMRAEEYRGNWSSKVANWILPTDYTEQVALGSHRRQHAASRAKGPAAALSGESPSDPFGASMGELPAAPPPVSLPPAAATFNPSDLPF